MPTLNPAYQNYSGTIQAASTQYGVPVPIILAVGQQESGWGTNPNTNIPGAAGDTGIMQLTPPIQQQFGVTNPTDPTQNIMGGTAYLAQLYQTYGNWQTALTHYNGSGPAAQLYGASVWANAQSIAQAQGTSLPGGNNGLWSQFVQGWGQIMSGVGQNVGGINPVMGGTMQGMGAIAQGASLTSLLMPALVIGGAVVVGIIGISTLFKSSGGGSSTIVPIPV